MTLPVVLFEQFEVLLRLPFADLSAARQNGRMAKKQKNQPAGRKKTSADGSPRADVITSLWMLSVLTALLCEVGSAVVLLLGREQQAMAVLAAILMTGALVVGVLSLILAAGVFKLRKDPPPRGITVFALVVGAMPLVIFALTLLRN